MILFALDMDGTTLSSSNEISLENIAAIQNAQSLGHKVMVLSGRAPESIQTVLDQYNLQLPMGGSNGTAVYADGKLLELTSLSHEQNLRIAEKVEQEAVPFKLYTNKGTFIQRKWSERLEEVLASGTIPASHYDDENFGKMTRVVEDPQLFDSIEDLLEDEELAIQKFFMLVLDPAQKERLLNVMNAMDGVYVTTSSPFNIEVMNITGNKGNGLKVMAEYLQIPMENTVAIGDQFNDLPMFEAAGFAVAMGNAENEIKRHSDYVTLTNDENGVAHAIELVLKKEAELELAVTK
ncbi:HAD superfamily hydrolase [Fictibacillus macauensis ZFHKF-1]|uniref:HAD superfamily hydrolase n=1 Tax=Fictibacillus macauensis ZFHKF-1 TaxID=1196324 RepID=I8AKJ5_9BACL|nr:Cof-type HAD-IIB family hydrolase [Fictibacillus macauensis]EIT86089.1 HAD superfamily hydrolase [Fictibacillus macauensis ZFHKF-1]